jgi:hypothetical protein
MGSAAHGSRVRAMPRISFVVPSSAEVGSTITASGTVLGAVGGGSVRVEARSAGRWGPIGRVPLKVRRFSLTFVAPAGPSVETRAVWFHGGSRLAVSAVRRTAIGTSATTPASASAAAPATTGLSSSTAGAPTVPQEEPAGPAPPSPPPPSTTNSYWGGWIGPQLTGEEAPWDMDAVSAFESEVGKAPSLIEFGSPFADCSSNPCTNYSFPDTPFEDIRARGAIPFLSWSSQSLPSSLTEPEYELSDIAEGTHDTYIREFAEAAAAWGHPFFLRFDWEMNGAWFPWGAGVNNNTATDYVDAWRHVHQIFVELGATNASWVWCPYVNPNNSLPDMASFYPGDDYVDWTCLDGYNWGPSAQPPRTWRSFSYLFGPSYRQITETVAPAKPMLIGETASSEVGGSKAEWINSAFAALPGEFPLIQGLIWFEKEDDGMDWPVETSTSATTAFRNGISGPRYLGASYSTLSSSPIPRP